MRVGGVDRWVVVTRSNKLKARCLACGALRTFRSTLHMSKSQCAKCAENRRIGEVVNGKRLLRYIPRKGWEAECVSCGRKAVRWLPDHKKVSCACKRRRQTTKLDVGVVVLGRTIIGQTNDSSRDWIAKCNNCERQVVYSAPRLKRHGCHCGRSNRTAATTAQDPAIRFREVFRGWTMTNIRRRKGKIFASIQCSGCGQTHRAICVDAIRRCRWCIYIGGEPFTVASASKSIGVSEGILRRRKKAGVSDAEMIAPCTRPMCEQRPRVEGERRTGATHER